MEVAITSPNCIFRRVTTFCFYLFVAGVTSVRGEQSAAQIIRPGAQQTFHYQDTVEVAYESDFARPWISTWCEVDGLSQGGLLASFSSGEVRHHFFDLT